MAFVVVTCSEEKYGIKATFFTIGQNIKYYPDTFAKIVEGGHEIGNHTFSHPHLQNGNLQTLTKELQRTETVLGNCQKQDLPDKMYPAVRGCPKNTHRQNRSAYASNRNHPAGKTGRPW